MEFEKHSSLCVKRKALGRRVSSPAMIGCEGQSGACGGTRVTVVMSTANSRDNSIFPKMVPDIKTLSNSALGRLSSLKANKKFKRSSKRYGIIAGTNNSGKQSVRMRHNFPVL